MDGCESIFVIVSETENIVIGRSVESVRKQSYRSCRILLDGQAKPSIEQILNFDGC